jgi:hypothetical protein
MSLLVVWTPVEAADLSITFETVARSGETPIPGGVGDFTGFGQVPSVDASGSVLFTGTGGAALGKSFQSGIYTLIDNGYQKVADRNTLVPGGGGVTFDVFRGADLHDIDNGRVVFMADISELSNVLGVYTNVGQPNPGSLVEVAVADGSEWSEVSDPWVDGNEVAMRGRRFGENEFLIWDGSDRFANPGAGYIVSPGTVASLSDGVSVFRRYQVGSSQLGTYQNGVYDPLVTLGVTLMPNQGGQVFTNVNNYPVIDRGGLDVAFRGLGSSVLGVYKRSDGGSLQQVADNATVVPGSEPIPGLGDQVFTMFLEESIALAEGEVAFWAEGLNSLSGLYTDIGGGLAVVLDNETNRSIVLDGVTEQVTRVSMGSRGLARTDSGHVLVFHAALASGGTAVIRATIAGDVVEPPVVDSYTVYKDYSDNNTDSVSVALTCSSGIVTNSPQWAREGVPAQFTIEDASAGATCTATETSVAAGYTKDESQCRDQPLNGSCTIVNTLEQVDDQNFTVYKQYTDNARTYVNIHLECTGGTVTNTPQLARPGRPAVFEISNAPAGATCTASEPWVPDGYQKDESDCQDGDPVGGSCTVVNRAEGLSTATFIVRKDYSDNNTDSVNIALSCSSGIVTNSPQWAQEGAPAEFTIEGAEAGATCTATETSVADGYTKDESACQNRPLDSSCTIVNTADQPISNGFTVYKDYSDDNTDSVSVALTCSSGTVTNSPQWAREGVPAQFTIEDASAGATCTATETSVADGYTKDESACQNRPLDSSCTIVNTADQPISNGFTVYKDFSDNNTASVSIELSCTSGVVLNTPQWASESSPAQFTIEGASAGSTCIATETSVAAGYTKDESDCLNQPLDGACTIVNTLELTQDSFTVFKDFSDDNSIEVSIGLQCTSGTIINSPQVAVEGLPAVFTVEGADAGTVCSATELSDTPGYTKDESGCLNQEVGGSCTIVNTLDAPVIDTFTVYTDFSDDNPADVLIDLSCTDGLVLDSPLWASETTPAQFSIEAAAAGSTCTASASSIPAGYQKDETDCQDGDPVDGFCTIVNNREASTTETVYQTGFEEGSADEWLLKGDVMVDGVLAIGQYSLRHGKGSSSEFSVSTLGYRNVIVSMQLAGSSMKKQDKCRAQISPNMGETWHTVVEVTGRDMDAQFYAGELTLAAAEDNADLRLQFDYTGRGKGGYCYGDEIKITGTTE